MCHTMTFCFVFLLFVLVTISQADGSSCFGATFQTTQSNFEYQAYLKNTDCDLSNTNVTSLYMLGACCRGRMNNFGPHPPPCGPGDWNIMDASSNTCEDVFTEANGTPDVRKVHGFQEFDMGEVCSDGIYGVIFVQTDCSGLNASSVVLKQRPGGSNFCWSGHTLSRGALAGIVVACMVGVSVLVGAPVAACWWRWRRQRQRTQVLEDGKAQAPQTLQIVKVADSVFLTKQDARKSSLYASHLLEQPSSQAYDIDLESRTSNDDVGGVTSHSLKSGS